MLADRLDRLKVVVVCQSLSVVQSLLLFGFVFFDAITIELLFALALFQGAVGGFNQPARQSLIPSLVKKEDLTSAVAINSIIFNVARFIGPAIAGVVIAAYGLAPAFAINAASYLCVIFALLIMKLPPREAPTGRQLTILGDMLLGFRYTMRHATIGPLILLSLAMSLLVRPMNELLPAATELIFAAGAGGLAMLTAARGVGATLAGLVLAKRHNIDGLAARVVFSALLSVISVVGFIATEFLWVGVLALVVFRLCDDQLGRRHDDDDPGKGGQPRARPRPQLQRPDQPRRPRARRCRHGLDRRPGGPVLAARGRSRFVFRGLPGRGRGGNGGRGPQPRTGAFQGVSKSHAFHA